MSYAGQSSLLLIYSFGEARRTVHASPEGFAGQASFAQSITGKISETLVENIVAKRSSWERSLVELGGFPPAFNLITNRSLVSCDIDITTDGQTHPWGTKSHQLYHEKIPQMGIFSWWSIVEEVGTWLQENRLDLGIKKAPFQGLQIH